MSIFYNLSLHDALPIYKHIEDQYRELIFNCFNNIKDKLSNAIAFFLSELIENAKDHSDANNFYIFAFRSEEHTTELQSRAHLVCRLLIEDKKTTIKCKM